ncbi:family 16 glycoside hydrolase [Melampsora larici-populina 98AG31]|uniref:Family 16 glycoside hydrolase n=1 Tax=Melampsora larici-populina (strain 98AG31 / pathotype 3-4-7) TaxID=747676 RepID=F4S5Z3_MELLP|nr:family 16 glycoside hydrolase [Melampsora larici-populina 98AG31]EGF99846.1 family 16 glycoside hydrolase [Melampsora larici-populina 98AG31]
MIQISALKVAITMMVMITLPTTFASHEIPRPHHIKIQKKNHRHKSQKTRFTGLNRQVKPAGYVPGHYKLVSESSGHSFFDNWDFFSDADPTHGMVSYQPVDEAWKSGLVSTSPNSAKIQVDNSSWLGDGEPRKSVRITSKSTFKYGLLVLDAIKMPFGCSTWPAFWTVGDNWPMGGEIDIVEGVNMLTKNQMTLHTASGCSVQTPMSNSAMGTVLDKNCDAALDGNSGCGVSDPSEISFGKPFNDNGGGVFVMEWKQSGITIWRFARDQLPTDLTPGHQPNPDSWSSHPPLAHWSNDECNNLSNQFGEHRIVFDITLCGDWAGSQGAYTSGGQCGGSCSEAVKDPANFKDAAWEVASVRLYQ